MKVALIVVLALLLAVSGGLLAYGASLGTSKTYVPEKEGLLLAPPDDIFRESETPIDVSSLLAVSLTTEQAADALLAVTYDSLMTKQYYFSCHVDALSGNKYSCSDYFRIVRDGRDFFYQALTYGGGFNVGVRHISVGTTRLDATTLNVSYDRSTKVFEAAFGEPEVSSTSGAPFKQNPYRLFGLFGLPLNLSGEKGTVDYSVTTGAIVSLVAPTVSEPFYTLSLSLDASSVNASAETIRRLNDGAGGKMKNINVHALDFVFEIWECGLFRSIEVTSEFTATLGRKSGQGKINRSYAFSYDKNAGNILARLQDANWEKYVKEKDSEASPT